MCVCFCESSFLIVIDVLVVNTIFVSLKCITYEYMLILETGVGEEKDSIWGKTQEEVWNARRLWMGR